MASTPKTLAVIGGGPAGLMAAEVASAAGLAVTVYEKMPSVGRKFLMAGRGGLNLTHSEDAAAFLGRYGARAQTLRPFIEAFDARTMVAWAEGLGQPTFVGSSGRMFPKAMKASPLLRAWLTRLAEQDVVIRTRMDWQGWDDQGALMFQTGEGARETVFPAATVLALGGASWPKLGSDGAWRSILTDRGVQVAPFQPANGGFTVEWSAPFRARFAGSPLKTIALTFDGRTVRGEAMITGAGIEGGAVYALSARLRDAVALDGAATVMIDIRPDLSLAALEQRLAKPRGSGSLSNHLRKAGLTPLAVNLLREAVGSELPTDPAPLARLIKALPLRLTGAAPLERAISTAGGVNFDALDPGLAMQALPAVFVAGEMLDWEAPTGGYLLQACFATGAAAGRAAVRLLQDDL